jgi:hypothetical protein
MKIYFGKFKGRELRELPDNYVNWVAHRRGFLAPEPVTEACEIVAQRRGARAAAVDASQLEPGHDLV